MAHGKSIKLFLTDGSPNGILTAEIINWTGHVLSAPRTKLSELIQREECARTGVYFLVGHDPENSLPSVYIGESDDVANRLKQHNRTEESGGKDFWEKVCLVTGKDQNITKTHIKYLESRLIEIAKRGGQCQLINGTSHQYNRLPESDTADMEYFLEQIQVVLPVLGFDFLKEMKKPSQKSQTLVTTISSEIAEETEFYLATKDTNANAKVIDGEFYVLAGSQVRREVTDTKHTYTKNLRPQLFENNIIDSDTYTFNQDYLFSSPSAAGGVILGRASNGRKDWRQVGTNITYGQWLENQVDSIELKEEL
ncbi:GIY-YIG nuclease family protein [Acinetobacter baumannii]|uniref:GIY-YIG nuclease family protein n=1 Tax=Acinetobacter baumannii TaxID=470 RepID=UPI000449C79C|nr:GIY-YIG nuclease family protein [Acinetobacter baumannii]EXR19069.1 GIY-YIG catalytic domain protein [Acinetobacter baumannii 1295549]EXS35636.1 GIY-YIG catalytic domain protein [Acinetobacter baumannii 426863]